MTKSRDAFRTISEVADWLGTPAHVLRFWESKFSQIKPVKRAGGRRYYRPNDMLLLGGLKKLLHEDGLTIKGAQQLLREKGTKHVIGISQPLDDTDAQTIDVETVDPPVDLIQEKPAAEVQGLPPQSLAQETVDPEPEPEIEPVHELKRELDPEPGASELPDHLPDQTGDGPLPFIHRNLDGFGDDNTPENTPERSDKDNAEGTGEHFIQTAARSVEAEIDDSEVTESIPAPKLIAPAGPLRLDELRQSLSVAKSVDTAKLATIAARLTTLRDKIAENAGSGTRD